MISVVNVRDGNFTLYIGRKFAHFEASKWANPFRQRRYGFKCLEMYEAHVRKNLMTDLHELDGHVLGCWCKPRSCHGDILKRLRQEQLDAKIDQVHAEHSTIQANVGESN